MKSRLRVLLACAVLLVGCGQGATTTPTSSAEPASPVAIDSLPLTLAEVQEKTKLPLREQRISSRDMPSPNEVWTSSALTQFLRITADTPLKDADGRPTNQDVKGFYLVTQTVAIYSDGNSAQEVFDRISKALQNEAGSVVTSVDHESLVVNSEQQKIGKDVTVLRKARNTLAQVYVVPANSNIGAVEIGDAIVSKINRID